MAVSSVLAAPSIAELEARAEALVPVLRERAARTEELRRVPNETIDDFQRAGFFRVFVPKRYGGYELDYGLTQIALGRQLGRGCGSSAWVQSVVACHAWILGMCPPEAQETVWGNDPDALVTTAGSATTGKGTPVAGGYFVEGQWQFSSGIHAATYVLVGINTSDNPREWKPRYCLIPKSEYEIVDTWFAAGLRGTGSQDVRVQGLFVPEEHTLDLGSLMGREPPPGSAVNACYIYRLPLIPVFPWNLINPAVGVARGAVEQYVEQTAGRLERASQTARMLRIAQSAAEADAADALLWKDAHEIKQLGEAGLIPPEARVRWLRDTAYAGQLCFRAVKRLAAAVGAHGLPNDNPIQRAFRDVNAIGNHVGLSFDHYAEVFGRTAVTGDPSEPRIWS